MTKKILLGLTLTLALAACGHQPSTTESPQMKEVARYRLGGEAEMRLVTDSNLSQVELYYGGDLQELAGTANTLFVTDSTNRIAIDTVHVGGENATQYIVQTYDRSSTYGAEVWYVVYPYRVNDPEGPWNLIKIPTDRPTLEDVSQYIR